MRPPRDVAGYVGLPGLREISRRFSLAGVRPGRTAVQLEPSRCPAGSDCTAIPPVPHGAPQALRVPDADQLPCPPAHVDGYGVVDADEGEVGAWTVVRFDQRGVVAAFVDAHADQLDLQVLLGRRCDQELCRAQHWQSSSARTGGAGDASPKAHSAIVLSASWMFRSARCASSRATSSEGSISAGGAVVAWSGRMAVPSGRGRDAGGRAVCRRGVTVGDRVRPGPTAMGRPPVGPGCAGALCGWPTGSGAEAPLPVLLGGLVDPEVALVLVGALADPGPLGRRRP